MVVAELRRSGPLRSRRSLAGTILAALGAPLSLGGGLTLAAAAFAIGLVLGVGGEPLHRTPSAREGATGIEASPASGDLRHAAIDADLTTALHASLELDELRRARSSEVRLGEPDHHACCVGVGRACPMTGRAPNKGLWW